MLFLRKSFSVKLMIQIGKNQRSFLVLFLLLFFSESRRRTCVVRTSKTRAEDNDVISSACAAEGKGQTEVRKRKYLLQNLEPTEGGYTDIYVNQQCFRCLCPNIFLQQNATVLVSDWLPAVIYKSTDPRSWRDLSRNTNACSLACRFRFVVKKITYGFPLFCTRLTTNDVIKCSK